MSYHKFLGKTETLVLPHFGGVFVEARGRRLRLDAPLDPGWWQLEIKGRKATAIGPADTESSALENLPIVRGHALGDRLVRNGAVAEPIFFLPADQPAPFAPLRARTWPTGQLLFEAVDFEGEAEETVRRALEDQRPIHDVRGISATLRAAYGFAVALDVARRLQVPISPAEIAGRIVEFAERADGRAIAETMIRGIAREREEEFRASQERRRMQTVRGRAEKIAEERAARGGVDAEERADAALSGAGASLLNSRSLSGGRLEVTYRLRGERFITIVERDTLRVVDAGVCLAGADQMVTLESLPGVILQAIAESRLVITRR
jgi:hypothetical protein